MHRILSEDSCVHCLIFCRSQPGFVCCVLGPSNGKDSYKWVRLQQCVDMVRIVALFLAFFACLFLAPPLLRGRPTTVMRTQSAEWPVLLDPPLSKNPITSLAALAALPPPVPPSPSCRPPPLPTEPICNDTAFSGQRLDKPRKLALMLMFGFEVDTLEVQLREVVDLVDVIFIVEATVTHHGVGRATLKLLINLYFRKRSL